MQACTLYIHHLLKGVRLVNFAGFFFYIISATPIDTIIVQRISVIISGFTPEIEFATGSKLIIWIIVWAKLNIYLEIGTIIIIATWRGYYSQNI